LHIDACDARGACGLLALVGLLVRLVVRGRS